MKSGLACIALVLVLLTQITSAQAAREAEFRVVDPTGALVFGSTLTVNCVPGRTRTLYSEHGTFHIKVQASSVCKGTIFAPGFETSPIDFSSTPLESTILLTPAAAKQSITVTASRSPLAPTDLPITETTLSRRDFAVAPAVTIDDKLRQVPGFSLFRRSGSQTANPTTQGVSLRGLGASGSSRSLILQDGLPLNDPFGGWIYWGRVPLASIQDIAIIEGGASDLYGSNALGGVINLESRAPFQTAFFGESSFGSLTSPLGTGGVTIQHGAWGASFFGEGSSTEGYIPVQPSERGSVDLPAASKHQSADLLIQRAISGNNRVFLRGNLFGESRQNGTALQENNTTIRQLSAGADWTGSFGAITLRAFGGTQTLHQTFSAIAPGRNSETLTTDQHVPVTQYGFTSQWSRLIGTRHVVTLGVDYRDITGDTNEQGYFGGNPTAFTISGGRQQSTGIYAEDVFQLTPRWIIAASLRGDLWRNIDASSRRFPTSDPATLTPFANRSNQALSPRLGVTRIVNDRFSLHASAYRSFRAPTLNELYRPFRVGNVVTQSNPDLKAEYFTGGEFGGVAEISHSVRLRGTAFFGTLDDSVGNITLSTTPTLITRQRQNLGTVRIRGFEFRSETRLSRFLMLNAGYQFTDAVVKHFRSDPTLIGLRTPQVPRNVFTFQATYDNPRRLTVAVQGRAVGKEFDDDRNTFALDPYFNLGLYVSREVHRGLTLFGAAENLLNSRYAIGRTPVKTIAAPVEARVGIKFQVSARESAN